MNYYTLAETQSQPGGPVIVRLKDQYAYKKECLQVYVGTSCVELYKVDEVGNQKIVGRLQYPELA